MNQTISITAKMVKKLRELTGCGFLDCKKALEQANGDVETAIDVMRKKGQAKASQKTKRLAKEGIVAISVTNDRKKAFMVEVNCETDFVARNENFKNFVQRIVERGLDAQCETVEIFLALPFSSEKSRTIDEVREELIVKIGENIQIKHLFFIKSPFSIYHYLHRDRIGVLVEIGDGDPELGKDIAMHIAASKPSYISSDKIPAAKMNHEKEIYLAQALATGKPKEIAEKIVSGRIENFIKEVTLLEQSFIKDPTVDIKLLLQKYNAEVFAFTRFAVGEEMISS